MSTTIDVYPATDLMPLVEQTRARTQELFQELFDRRGIASTIEVKAFDPNAEPGSIDYVAADLRWCSGLALGFGYWINSEWDSSSWPSCYARDEDDLITAEDLTSDGDPDGSPPEFLGEWWIAQELADVVASDKLAKILRSDHYWSEYRNMGGPEIASTGYGLAAAALAEATDGVVASFDCAFDIEHNGETAGQFLSWWGDAQIDWYGPESFLARTAS
ncbi:hypothetical protein [Mycolicibacterium peregrinum]|uniref:hypothetical protein n=1 Tax=Mycolicibacterium peregrinum TaxID=43304 RepID=UPI003AABF92B